MIGYHLILDGILDKEVNREKVEEILSGLPAKIDMKILEGHVVVEGLPGNPSWTGFVIIEKSQIVIHTFEEGDKVSVDVFSCKYFNKDKVEEYLKNRMPLKSYNLQLLKRSEECMHAVVATRFISISVATALESPRRRSIRKQVSSHIKVKIQREPAQQMCVA